MAQIRKAEGQVEIKSDADKYYDIWTKTPYQAAKMTPKFPKIELNEGDWHTVGSVITWHYNIGGKTELVKTKIEEIDENRRSASYKAIDGNVLKSCYNVCKTKLQVIPKGENGGSIVKWEFEYEKMNEDAPDGDVYLDIILGMTRDIDAHLSPA